MSEFAKKVALTGATQDNLNTLLVAAGYAFTIPYMLVLRATKTNTASIYVGSASNVDNTTGFEMEPGDVYVVEGGGRPSPVQLTQFYLYAAATQGLEVMIHA